MEVINLVAGLPDEIDWKQTASYHMLSIEASHGLFNRDHVAALIYGCVYSEPISQKLLPSRTDRDRLTSLVIDIKARHELLTKQSPEKRKLKAVFQSIERGPT